MWHLATPSFEEMQRLAERNSALSYPVSLAGSTRHWRVDVAQRMSGFDCDQNICLLGHGEHCFEKAVEGLRTWKMFPSWAQVTSSLGQEEGSVVRLLFRLLGLYWHSCGRVVYAFSEEHTAGAQRRVGFAYGTLLEHVECGEERFSVAWLEDDRVVYELQAFSRPRFWMARLAKPLARHWQRKFVRDSKAAFQLYLSSDDT